MSSVASVFLQDQNFIDVMYIIAFGLFIYGLSGLTGPRTAVRGNQIAAVGMVIAVVATLISKPGGVSVLHGSSTPWLIALGLIIGTAVGVPAARNVKMTQMPQMVALFNGVGGGAVALIAWVEYRHRFGLHPWALRVEIPSLFAAIVGSVSFWGSNIAFGKLQEILPGKPIKLPGASQTLLNGLLLLICVVSAVILAAGTHSQGLFIVGILLAAAVLGNMVVLPIGGADMPVVISLLNASDRFVSCCCTGLALGNNQCDDRRRHDRGCFGHHLDQPHGQGHEPVHPGSIVAGGFGGAMAVKPHPRRRCRCSTGAKVRSSSAPGRGHPDGLRATRSSSYPDTGLAVAQAQHAVKEHGETALESQGCRGQVRHSPGRRPYARSHERSSRRGGCLVRR